MPAPLFKRFAPPTPATQKKSPPPAPSPAPVQELAAEKPSPEAVTPKKEKKSKKRKSEASEPVSKSPDPQDHVEDVVMEDVSAETPKSSKKSKKRKSEVIEDEDAEISKKHKAVFSKFEKASKLAEARKDQEGAEDNVQQPEEELHGKPVT
jgi:ATP-dependent RNA helicase DDX51/DBP6